MSARPHGMHAFARTLGASLLSLALVFGNTPIAWAETDATADPDEPYAEATVDDEAFAEDEDFLIPETLDEADFPDEGESPEATDVETDEAFDELDTPTTSGDEPFAEEVAAPEAIVEDGTTSPEDDAPLRASEEDEYEEDVYRTSISGYQVEFSSKVYWHTGKSVCPSVRVYEYREEYTVDDWDDEGYWFERTEYDYYGELTRGVDYKVSYANNVNVGTATMTITGVGDYEGTLRKSFPIRYNIAKATSSKLKAKTYSGKAYTPKPTVTYAGKRLALGTDYTLSYKKNKKAGTAQVIVNGKGSYGGSKTVTFKIKKKSLKKAKVAKVADKRCTGKKIKPKPKVKLGKTKLKKGRDYTLKYKNNKNAGTATIIIKGKGNYSGKKKVTFRIVGSAPSGRSGSSGSSGTVYKTKTGECYHRDGCSSLRRSKIPISRSDAEAEGLRPCKNCNP